MFQDAARIAPRPTWSRAFCAILRGRRTFRATFGAAGTAPYTMTGATRQTTSGGGRVAYNINRLS